MRGIRRSIRMKGYDYRSAGVYFLTIVAQGRSLRFGDVDAGELHLNDAGEMVRRFWEQMPERFPSITMDQCVVMPNHIHGIVVIHQPNIGALLVGAHHKTEATTRVAPTRLGDIVGAFKSLTTLEYARGVDSKGWPPFDRRLRQRNYYEHVIRSEAELADTRTYISNNPLEWTLDRENPRVILP